MILRITQRLNLFLVFYYILLEKKILKGGIPLKKEKARQELLEQDLLCFRDSQTNGVKALMNWFSKDAIVINEKHSPNAVGEEDIIKLFESVYQFDSYELSWEPLSSDISDDSTLGYTTGKYTKKYKQDGKLLKQIGKYVLIWKKCDGEWKIALDIANK